MRGAEKIKIVLDSAPNFIYIKDSYINYRFVVDVASLFPSVFSAIETKKRR